MTVTTEVRSYSMFVNGTDRSAASGRTYLSTDPYLQEAWAEVPDGEAADVDLAVDAARNALAGPWGAMPGTERARLMRRLADLLLEDAAALAELESRDNGKLVREMAAQMQMLPEWFYYYAGLADKLGGDVMPSGKPNFLVYTKHEPVGVVAAIVPWNSPLLLMAWKLAPALAAGCTFVVKPSDYTPVSTLAFAAIVRTAGFPPGVFNVVTGNGPAVGKALAAHPGVDKVAFTGSTAVGIDVAVAAAKNLTGVLLELGGKSAQLIFPDADVEVAANGVVSGIFAATGQSCMAGSRVLVHEDVAADLIRLVTERARTIRLGDPRDPATEMGPVSNQAQYDRVMDYISSALEDGAQVAHGGKASGLGGLFVEPTVLVGTRPGMRVVDEEIFGPVVSIMTFTDEDDAVRQANATVFGLAGSVWTKDVHRAHRVAGRLLAGTVWINAYRSLAPGVPFGGFKTSGLGRENGPAAVHEFTQTKSVWVELSGTGRDPFTIG